LKEREIMIDRVGLRFIGAFICSSILLAGCGGSSAYQGSPNNAPSNFTLGGTVSGLSGSGLTLNNGSTAMQISTNNAFTFPGSLANGTTYNVVVSTHPSNPRQSCTVTNGSGTIGGNVTNVSVTCATVALTVEGATPSEGATNVERTTQIVITFSDALDQATVTTDNVTLSRDASAVPVTLAVSGSQLTVTPQSKLQPNASYSLSISPAVRGAQGETLASVATLSFSTTGRSWLTAALVPIGPKKTCCINTATAPNGDPLLVWSDQELQPASGAAPEQLSTEHRLTRFSPGQGWSLAQELNSDVWENPDLLRETGTHSWIRAASSSMSEIFVLFITGDGSRLQVNRLTSEDGWVPKILAGFQVGRGVILNPYIDVNDAGEALVVWEEFEFEPGGGPAGDTRMMSASFASGQWSTPEELTPPDPFANIVQFAVTRTGDAFAIWRYSAFAATNGRLAATRYEKGDGWQPAEVIGSEALFPGDVRLDVDADGDAVVIFVADHTTMRWTRYSEGAWTPTLPVVPGSVEATDSPALSLAASGAGFAIWESKNGVHSAAQIAHYSPENGWTMGPQLDDASAGDVKFPSIAVGEAGDAMAVWCQEAAGRAHTWAAYFANGAWQAAQRIEQASPAQVCSTRVTLDASGNATAFWFFRDADDDLKVMFNRYE
jgi:hypothetical protein